MKIRLASEQASKLIAALRRAGTSEIGGQLYGEQLAPSDFLVTDLTLQSRPGTVARFVVDLLEVAAEATRFFIRTKHEYTRFNYIGEWHSHPSFAVRPSETDVATMRGIVGDAEFQGSFAVLMIVRLDPSTLTTAAWVFDPQGNEYGITLEVDIEQ